MSAYSESFNRVKALLRREAFEHSVTTLALIETHISWVILTGEIAYKFKKPLDLGFLDFSTLQKRRDACFDELRLNQRLAPELYLDVCAVSPEGPKLCMPGDCPAPVEYAVRMRQFAPEDELHAVLARGELTADALEEFAESIAAFHNGLEPARPRDGFATPEKILRPVAENIRTIHTTSREFEELLARIKTWSREQHEALRPVFQYRLESGRVRECHGDLHTHNLVRLNDRIVAFDCIEFSADLRWIDVVNDIAFLVMDLLYEKRPNLAYRFLSAWLENTGDYAGMAVVRFYLVYRAMVRAKIAAITLRQHPDDGSAALSLARHLALAHELISPAQPRLIVCCGLSGSGKSWLSRRLIGPLRAVRIRSDVERKRLFGFGSTDRTESGTEQGIYTPEASARVYELIAASARAALTAGSNVIVDAACLKREQREQFYALARELGVTCVLVVTEATVETLKARTAHREKGPRQVSEAGPVILSRQLDTAELPMGSERKDAIVVQTDTDTDVDVAEAARRIRAI